MTHHWIVCATGKQTLDNHKSVAPARRRKHVVEHRSSSAVRQIWRTCLVTTAPGRRYRHIEMNLSPAGILRDAGKGVAATGRLFRAAVRHPWGKESVTWRVWATPLEIAGLAVAALSSAAFGYATWLQPLLPSLGPALVALLLFAWLGRRCERHWPDA